MTRPELLCFCFVLALAGCHESESDPTNQTGDEVGGSSTGGAEGSTGEIGSTSLGEESSGSTQPGEESGTGGAPTCTEDGTQLQGTVLLAQNREFPPDLDFGFVRFAPAWGDFGMGPHGTFARIPAGMATPPHVHSAAYSAVVIEGTVVNPFGTENESPELEKGSFWHVPAGEQHVTACVSEEDCWGYIYMDEGFDFEPIEMLTDPRSEQARAIPADEIALEAFAPFVSFGTVEGDFATGPHGTFGLFPGGEGAPAHVHSADYHGVTITGALVNPFADEDNPPLMAPGSAWSVPGSAEHITACESEEDCLIFIHGDAGFDVEFVCE